MRIDKWIWAVRMVKTRSLGADLCKAGHVLLNGQKIKASHELRQTDVVEVRQGTSIKRYKVLQLLERRLGAKEAAAYFEDLSPPPAAGNNEAPVFGRRERGAGRPTKKDRRALAKIRQDYF